MTNRALQDVLTAKQQDLCNYTGLFGVLIALTCLIQHIAITRAHWITFMMVGIYLFIITAFVMIALQKVMAPILLIIAAVFSLIAELILIMNDVFSLAVVVLLIYTVVIVVVMYLENIPGLLKQKAVLLKAEEDLWKDKI